MGVNLLGKIKLYELAKEMDISSKDLLEKAKKMGIEVKSHLSVISDEDVAKLKGDNKAISKSDEKIKPKKTDKKSEEKLKKDNPVIIRREVIIQDEPKKEEKKEEKRNNNSNPFVQRNQNKDYNIVYRNKPEKPMTVSELFGLGKKKETPKPEPKPVKEVVEVE